MSKIIGFLGTYPVDICLYAAFSLQNTGKRVCVIDYSEDGILYHCIPSPDEQLKTVTCYGVDFMRKQPFLNWQELEYEFIFVQFGGQPQELCLTLCSRLILVVDCERRNLDFYRQFMKETRMPMTVLLRGFCPDGMPVRKMKDYFAVENDFIDKWMTLPINEMDEAYRTGLQYEQFKKFTYISAGMEKLLVQLLRQLESGSRIGRIRAVKRAKCGKAAYIPEKACQRYQNKRLPLSEAAEYGGFS